MNDKVTELMNRISDLIRQAEVKMREKHLNVPAEFESLKWEILGEKRKMFRVTCEGKVFQECKFELKSQHFEKLPGLIEAAKKARFEKFGRIDPEKVQEISNLIMDL